MSQTRPDHALDACDLFSQLVPHVVTEPGVEPCKPRVFGAVQSLLDASGKREA